MYNCLLPTQTSLLLESTMIHINEINIHDISFKTDNKRVAKKLLALAILSHDVWRC